MKDYWQKALFFLGFYEDEEEEAPLRSWNPEEDEEEGVTPYVRKVHRQDRDESRQKLRSIITPQVEVNLMEPKSFEDIQRTADKFKSHAPTIINLQRVDKDTSQRIMDFVGGLIYGLDGKITSISPGVFLLTPKNVVIDSEEKKRLKERFFRRG